MPFNVKLEELAKIYEPQEPGTKKGKKETTPSAKKTQARFAIPRLLDRIRKDYEEAEHARTWIRPEHYRGQYMTGMEHETVELPMTEKTGIYMTEKPREGFAGGFSNIGATPSPIEKSPTEALLIQQIDAALAEPGMAAEDKIKGVANMLESAPEIMTVIDSKTDDVREMTADERLAWAKKAVAGIEGAAPGQGVGALLTEALVSEMRPKHMGQVAAPGIGGQPTAPVAGAARSRFPMFNLQTGDLTETGTHASPRMNNYYRGIVNKTPEEQAQVLTELPLLLEQGKMTEDEARDIRADIEDRLGLSPGMGDFPHGTPDLAPALSTDEAILGRKPVDMRGGLSYGQTPIPRTIAEAMEMGLVAQKGAEKVRAEEKKRVETERQEELRRGADKARENLLDFISRGKPLSTQIFISILKDSGITSKTSHKLYEKLLKEFKKAIVEKVDEEQIEWM